MRIAARRAGSWRVAGRLHYGPVMSAAARARCRPDGVARLVFVTAGGARVPAKTGGALYHRHCERCHGVDRSRRRSRRRAASRRRRAISSRGFLAALLDRRPRAAHAERHAARARARPAGAPRPRRATSRPLAAYLERLPNVELAEWSRRVRRSISIIASSVTAVTGRPELTIPGDARRPRDLGDPAVPAQRHRRRARGRHAARARAGMPAVGRRSRPTSSRR